LHQYPAFPEIFGTTPGSLQNFPGIVWSTPHDGAVGLLQSRSLADFKPDPAARRAYVDRYLGFDDRQSSRRVLEVIEADAAVRPSVAPAGPLPA
jgi:hypothetical protein